MTTVHGKTELQRLEGAVAAASGSTLNVNAGQLMNTPTGAGTVSATAPVDLSTL